MCNRLHSDSIVPKRKSGKAWKLFAPRRRGFRSLVLLNPYTNLDEDNYYVWESTLTTHGGVGFCCLPQRKEAEHALRCWNAGVLKGTGTEAQIQQISYKGAIARHIEYGIDSHRGHDTLLVERFRLV